MTDTVLQALADKVEAGERLLLLDMLCLGHGRGQIHTAQYAISAFNGSLDAAYALHQAAFPRNSHQWHVSDEANFDGFVCQIFSCAADRYVATAHQPTPARAWLLAILRALIAKEGGRDGQA